MIDWHIVRDFLRRRRILLALIAVWIVGWQLAFLNAPGDRDALVISIMVASALFYFFVHDDWVSRDTLSLYRGLPLTSRCRGNTFFFLSVCLCPAVACVWVLLFHLIAVAFGGPAELITNTIRFGLIAFVVLGSAHLLSLLAYRSPKARQAASGIWIVPIVHFQFLFTKNISASMSTFLFSLGLLLTFLAWYGSPHLLSPMARAKRPILNSPMKFPSWPRGLAMMDTMGMFTLGLLSSAVPLICMLPIRALAGVAVFDDLSGLLAWSIKVPISVALIIPVCFGWGLTMSMAQTFRFQRSLPLTPDQIALGILGRLLSFCAAWALVLGPCALLVGTRADFQLLALSVSGAFATLALLACGAWSANGSRVFAYVVAWTCFGVLQFLLGALFHQNTEPATSGLVAIAAVIALALLFATQWLRLIVRHESPPGLRLEA